MKAPWANKSSRFTLLFEAFAIEVINSCRSIKDAPELMDLNWYQIQSIMKMGGERGLKRRESTEISWVGMDEKSFRKGHNYILLLNDLERGCVIDVAEGRNTASANELINKGLNKYQQ
jgi:transposase